LHGYPSASSESFMRCRRCWRRCALSANWSDTWENEMERGKWWEMRNRGRVLIMRLISKPHF
jgi:hypothetical protein